MENNIDDNFIELANTFKKQLMSEKIKTKTTAITRIKNYIQNYIISGNHFRDQHLNYFVQQSMVPLLLNYLRLVKDVNNCLLVLEFLMIFTQEAKNEIIAYNGPMTFFKIYSRANFSQRINKNALNCLTMLVQHDLDGEIIQQIMYIPKFTQLLLKEPYNQKVDKLLIRAPQSQIKLKVQVDFNQVALNLIRNGINSSNIQILIYTLIQQQINEESMKLIGDNAQYIIQLVGKAYIYDYQIVSIFNALCTQSTEMVKQLHQQNIIQYLLMNIEWSTEEISLSFIQILKRVITECLTTS